MAINTASSTTDSDPRWVVAEGREAHEVEFEEGMVTFFVDAADLLGVPKSVAAVYGVIFASVTPLSFSELSARLNLSGGSVSQGLKLLREMGAIKAVPPDGEAESRGRDRFVPDLELRQLMRRFIEQRLEAQLNRGDRNLQKLSATAAAYTPESRDKIDQRLAKLRRWHNRARTVVPLIKTALKLPVP